MTLLNFDNVTKSYGSNLVLDGIDLEVKAGEVLALVGENGAGKSTLMKIAGGLAGPSTGTVRLDGERFDHSLAHAESSGIVMVHQELALAPDLTVAENVFLGRELTRGPFIDLRSMRDGAIRILADLGSAVSVKAILRDLPVSDWQMIELAKAFARDPRLILMDEPTAVLSAEDAANLFRRTREFCAGGGSVIFTSHRLDEVKEIADRVAVLRDGRIVRCDAADCMTEDEMAESMVGRPLAEIYPARRHRRSGDAVLKVTGLSSPDAVRGANLEIRRGEILGISGLVGSGRTELFEAIAGLRPAECTSFELNGVAGQLPTARGAWQEKLAYLTEDRKGKGLLLTKSLAENVALTRRAIDGGVWIDGAAEKKDLETAIETYDIRAGRRDVTAGDLSGGNQQKVLIAKTLASAPDLVIFDEPTRGVDIGAKQQIYRVIAGLADAGKSVVVISSEMQEIIGLSDRVLVMRQGRIAGELTGEQISESEIIRFAMGLKEEAIHA